jgi:hypothetical protein
VIARTLRVVYVARERAESDEGYTAPTHWRIVHSEFMDKAVVDTRSGAVEAGAYRVTLVRS